MRISLKNRTTRVVLKNEISNRWATLATMQAQGSMQLLPATTTTRTRRRTTATTTTTTHTQDLVLDVWFKPVLSCHASLTPVPKWLAHRLAAQATAQKQGFWIESAGVAGGSCCEIYETLQHVLKFFGKPFEGRLPLNVWTIVDVNWEAEKDALDDGTTWSWRRSKPCLNFIEFNHAIY